MKTNNLTLMKSALMAAALLQPMAALAAYEDVGVNPRVVGMGNAFTAVADDVYAIYYNPAGLATLDRPEAAASYARLMTGLSDNSNISNSFLAFERPIKGGRYGTAGVALNYFSLSGLYHETSFFGSYGREFFETYIPQRLYGGLSLKVLNRSVGQVAEGGNALGDTGIASGQPDPVLQNASKTNLDVDWGVLYRLKPRWSLGLMVQHFLEPNIAIGSGDTDKLGRNIKLGAAYRTPFSVLAMDVGFPKGPDGGLDKTVALAAEKWIPTLLYGTIGFRGSLAAGTRDLRQMGIGVSYKIFRMQFDYGFTMPLGGLATSGSHRMGLTWRFGRTKAPQPTVGQAILENIQDLAEVGSPEFRYQMEELTQFKRTAIEEFLRQAKVDTGAGRFADALTKVNEVASLKPNDAKIAESQARLKVVSDVYVEVKDFFTDPVQASIYDGALKFLSGKDKEALGNLAYAKGLNPADERIEALMKAIEGKSGVSREVPAAPAVAVPSGAVAVSTAAPAVPAPSPEELVAARNKQLVEGYMALMEVAFRQYEYEKVIQLAKQVLELDDTSVLAYKRMGAACHALKRYPEALAALQGAFKHEGDVEARKSLRSYINALASFIARSKEETAAARPARPAQPARPAALTPRDIERLYESGVEYYSRAQLNEAAAAFRQILEADPNNMSARRALRRVEAEMIEAGEKK